MGRLLLDPDSGEGAGWPHIDTGDLLEELGGGSENHHQRWHCHSLQAIISAEKKVWSHHRYPCKEKLKNK